MSKAMDIEKAASGVVSAQPAIVDTSSITTEIAMAPTKTTTISVTLAPPSVTAMTNGENNGKSADTAMPAAEAVAKTKATTAEQVQPTTAATAAAAAPNTVKSNMDPLMINFRVLYVLTQLCGITMIVLVGTWIGKHFGGLGGGPFIFNWHPLFMTIGFIYLYGNSILIYRGFRTVRKKTLKLTHAGIHLAAFILTVIALKTVFDSHNLAKPTPIPNMYSLHSWLGLSAVLIFCLQYVAGFMAYLVPGMKDNLKIALMPLHIYFGLFGFALAIASAVMGITEKAIFAIPNYSQLPAAGVLANIIGVLYVVFGGLVFYLATEPSYKRQALPEDTALLSSSNE